MTSSPNRRRAGFSVLEAIIVLAITSLALVLVFSIGARATATGFRLGRRALGVADAQIGVDSLRAALQGLRVPPPHSQGVVYPDLDGAADRLVGGVSFPRATPCAEAGPAGVLTLAVVRASGATRLTCTTSLDPPGAAPRVLAELGPGPAVFTYSLDGAAWSDRVHVAGASEAGGDPRLVFSQVRRLWVRLANDDGRFEVVETLSSGRPPPPRPETAG